MTLAEICAVFLHNLPELLAQFNLPESLVASKLQHILVSAVILLLPGAMVWTADLISSLWRQVVAREKSPRRPFVEQGYAYLPLVWGSTLAYYLPSLLLESGRILEVSYCLSLQLCLSLLCDTDKSLASETQYSPAKADRVVSLLCFPH